MWIFSGVPAWQEAWDIFLVVMFGVAVLTLTRKKILFADSPQTAKALWTGCFVYAATQFLSNHAEAQGIMLFTAWILAWEAKKQKQWKILLLIVLVKVLIFLSFFWSF